MRLSDSCTVDGVFTLANITQCGDKLERDEETSVKERRWVLTYDLK